MLTRKITITLCLFFTVISIGVAQTADKQKKETIFDWFYAPDQAIEVEFQTNLDSLVSYKMTNKKIPGVLTIANAEEQSRVLPASIRSRGRFRRRLCEFPPIKIDFDKDTLAQYGLRATDEYKLVTHCLQGKSGDENVLKEYLVYRLYQELTDRSFRVQLAKIKYLDERGKRYTTAYGFIIENEKELARRLNSELIEDRYNIAVDSIMPSSIHCHDLFQYMICNTDWNLPMVRNMKMLWDPAAEAHFVVPYDFDFSGLVNTSYSVPNADIGQKDVRERHYMGIAAAEADLSETLAIFRSRRNALLKMIKDFNLLNSIDRRDMMQYLDSFYESLEDGTFRTDLVKD